MGTGLIIGNKVHVRLLLTILSCQPAMAKLAAGPHVITTRDDEGWHALIRLRDFWSGTGPPATGR